MNEQRCEQTVRRGPIAVKAGYTQVEEPCGAPATTENGETLCWSHRLRQDREAFGTTGDDVVAIRKVYGVPDHVDTLKRYYAGATLFKTPAQRSARVEIIAFPLPGKPASVWPWVYDEFPGIDGPCIVARWRFRRRGKAGVLEVTWDRRRKREERFRRSLTIHGLGVDPDDLAKLWSLYPPNGEGLKAKKHAGGNPGYFSGPDDPRLFSPLGKAVHDVVKAQERVTWASLARAGFAGDWRTVKDYVECCPYDLDAIEREAVRCTSGMSFCRFDVRHAAEFMKK